MHKRTGTATATKYLLRLFEVQPGGSTEPPVALDDRHIEAASIDEARTRATELLEAERRPLRSISCLADGGLLAYVLPPLPAAEARPGRARRPRGRR